MLKVLAIPPALSAEREVCAQTWYAPPAASLGAGQAWMVRMGLNLIRLVLILIAMGEYSLSWLWSCLCLICLGTGEVMGRLRFYKAYRRIGL